jgi:hypothetical protein
VEAEMGGMLQALGRGIVKTLVSLFVGGGIGLLTFGTTTKDVPDLWERNGPPGGFFTALGAGMLATGAMMVLLFFLPRLSKDSAGKGAPYSELPR